MKFNTKDSEAKKHILFVVRIKRAVTVLPSELSFGLIAAEIYIMPVTVNEIVIEDYQVHVNSCLSTF